MPIRPSERVKYPANWAEISRQIKSEQGWRCAGSDRFPDCRAVHGHPHPVTGSKVVLTTAHRDHDVLNMSRSNLVAWCQRCHLTHDAKHHAANAAMTRKARKGNGDLFEERT